MFSLHLFLTLKKKLFQHFCSSIVSIYIMIISFIIVAATFATITWPRSKTKDYFSCRERTSRRGKQRGIKETVIMMDIYFFIFFTDHNMFVIYFVCKSAGSGGGAGAQNMKANFAHSVDRHFYCCMLTSKINLHSAGRLLLFPKENCIFLRVLWWRYVCMHVIRARI